jgi:hypothetical protein
MFDVEASLSGAREKFKALIDYLLGEGQGDDAYRVEAKVFRELLTIGLYLVGAWFMKKLGGNVGRAIVTEAGEELPREALKSRRYITIFGELVLWRWFYHRDGSPGIFPLDQETNLPESTYSYFVQDLLGEDVTGQTYDEALVRFEKLFGFRPPKHTIEAMAPAAAADADAYYESQGIPPPETEAEAIVQAIDGKGVPMVKEQPAEHKVRLGRGEKLSRKKEAVVSAVYTIAAQPRTADEVLAEVCDKETPPKRPKPQNKRVRATLDGKENAIAWARADAERRDPDHRKPRVCLMDGSVGLWTLALVMLAGATFILDFFHASEYLWKVAYVFHPEGSAEAEAFVRHHLRMLLEGKVGYVIGGLRQMLTKHAKTLTAAQRKILQTTIHYYERNRAYMSYDEYRAAGYPIGSGAVEGACRHLVKDRMEGSGMRWTVPGAEAVLKIRAVKLNGDWDPFWRFHMQQEARRRFGARQWAALPSSERTKAAG